MVSQSPPRGLRRVRAALSTAVLTLVLVLGSSVALAQEGVGAIRGVVYDLDFGVPLNAVRVTIVELGRSTETGDSGGFLIEGVPPGAYTLTFAKSGWEREIKPDVVVTSGALAELLVELGAEIIEMEPLVVSGADILSSSEIGLLELRMEEIKVQDSISSELISKAGASDVAGALKLVVGASVVEGKYATVRGMSDRYTGTTLNGIRVPSADPRKRAVQMDVFPTGTIENVTVSKTFTPDLPGDFTGGGVDVQTKSVPEEFVLKTSVSAEYDGLATGNEDFLTYREGGVPATGFAGEDRELPDEAKIDFPSRSSLSPKPDRFLTPGQIAAAQLVSRAANAFAPAMGVIEDAPGPNYGFSLVSGDRFELGGPRVIGLLGAISYSRKYDFYADGINNNAGVTNGETGNITIHTGGAEGRSDTRGQDELLIGGLGSAVLRLGDNHQFSLKTILNQSAIDQARLQEYDTGSSEDEIRLQQNQALRYQERTVGSAQLAGEHFFESDLAVALGPIRFEGVDLDWVGAFNVTRQWEPDSRFFRNLYNYNLETGEVRFSNLSGSTSEPLRTRRIFRDVDEEALVGKIDVTFPFTQWSESEGRIALGAFREESDRELAQSSFYYTFASRWFRPHHGRVLRWNTDDPTALWTDVFTEPDRIGLAPDVDDPFVPDNQLLWYLLPLNDVTYTGDQSIEAGYLMAELPLSPRLELVAGARYENTTIDIVPARKGGELEVIRQGAGGGFFLELVPEAEARASIDEGILLPALALNYDLLPTGTMKLRMSASRTIARPTYRELAPVATVEFLAGDEFIGNPDLSLAKIRNYDVRWEWFPRPGDVLAASVFYKDLTDPIELISFGAAGRTFVQPVNYETGQLLGAEFEARGGLGRFADWLEHVTIGTNLTFLDSEVDIPPVEQNSLAGFKLDEETRRLQGQPEYLFNLNVTYENDSAGFEAAVFYTRTGETLLTGAARGDVETGGVPAVYEVPMDDLTVRIAQRIGKHLSLSLKAKNLVDTTNEHVYRTPSGEEAVKRLWEDGRAYSVSFGYTW
jgi:TonB-dependent receptor